MYTTTIIFGNHSTSFHANEVSMLHRVVRTHRRQQTPRHILIVHPSVACLLLCAGNTQTGRLRIEPTVH